MDDIPLTALISTLVCLIILSGFFSSSETGMMALNRYRLRHLVKQKHRGARLANKLLKRPDRLISVILIGNNFVNIAAPVITTLIAIRLWGDPVTGTLDGITTLSVTVGLTLIILIFSEITPKTIAALHPERVAFPAAYVLRPLLFIMYPLVWLINLVTHRLLRIVGIKIDEHIEDQITQEELRTVVNEASILIPQPHQNMLLGILDLEKVTVEDIMVPRSCASAGRTGRRSG